MINLHSKEAYKELKVVIESIEVGTRYGLKQEAIIETKYKIMV